jgi:nitrate/TMAO reductase-like tetraheme cytochrome c subunit
MPLQALVLCGMFLLLMNVDGSNKQKKRATKSKTAWNIYCINCLRMSNIYVELESVFS